MKFIILSGLQFRIEIIFLYFSDIGLWLKDTYMYSYSERGFVVQTKHSI